MGRRQALRDRREFLDRGQTGPHANVRPAEEEVPEVASLEQMLEGPGDQTPAPAKPAPRPAAPQSAAPKAPTPAPVATPGSAPIAEKDSVSVPALVVDAIAAAIAIAFTVLLLQDVLPFLN